MGFFSIIRCPFHHRSSYGFYACSSQKRKQDWQLDCLFYAFGIWKLMKLSPGVDLTNPLTQSANAPAQRVWKNQFHQQICAQLQPLNTTRSYDECSPLYICKIKHKSTCKKAAYIKWMKLTPECSLKIN